VREQSRNAKKRATKLLAKHKLSQHAIDAGGVAFIAIQHCTICKAKDLNARGIKHTDCKALPLQGML
jgi:hypothetical protein